MGRDKATLPFGPELMLQRVVRLIGQVIDLSNVAVVAAPNQQLPELPAEVLVARDVHEFRGPLQGLATGLPVLADRADAVYATACDVPLLVAALVNRMFELLGDFDIAVPFDGEHHHSLAAVYRPSVLPHLEKLLDMNRMRPVFLFDQVPTRIVPVAELRAVDPQLGSLENLNYDREYRAALIAAGFETGPTF